MPEGCYGWLGVSGTVWVGVIVGVVVGVVVAAEEEAVAVRAVRAAHVESQ